jgi:exodeoxyribonuclease VII small subunit
MINKLSIILIYMPNTVFADIDNLPFENALRELEEIIQTMERGELGLDNIIEQYKRALALHKHCQQKLENAVMKVTEIDNDPNKS